MTKYTAPVDDMVFILDTVYRIGDLNPECDLETIQTILNEAGKLAKFTLSPLNATGDKTGCSLIDGNVTTAAGFREAYTEFKDSGWNGLPFDGKYGGQDLPWLLAFCVQEMWQAANMAFGLCPLLAQGAIETLHTYGTDSQKDTYLRKLVSGEWTGTMNLTEPQAGSDLSDLRTTAVRQDDGTFRLFGQKIYITYGEHDFTENIIHLVLARCGDAPEGTKGISLFLAPKFIPGKDGNPSQRNDLYCSGIEHKLGIHASPTCTMQFGNEGHGAYAELVGGENEGLKAMFTMMNNARLSVGLQGIAIADRAIQAAYAYAAERVQGKPLSGGEDQIPIIKHEDVQRMFRTCGSLIYAMRLLALEAATSMDIAKKGDEKAKARVDFLTPVVKAFCTDRAVDITSEAIQIFGGMGFIEETGAAQYFRDARILPIYEGTNGIQGNDLMFRKIVKDRGETLQVICEEMKSVMPEDMQNHAKDLEALKNIILECADKSEISKLGYAAGPLLTYLGYILCAWMVHKAEKISATKSLKNSEPYQTLLRHKDDFLCFNAPLVEGYKKQVFTILEK